MGDYLRFFFFHEQLTLAQIEVGFRSIDPKYSLRIDPAAPDTGDLLYGDEVYSQIEINNSGGELYQEDVEELREQIADGPTEDYAARQYVIALLGRATGLMAVHVSDFGNVYYDRIDPIWDWMFEHHDGLLQVDDEGYYDRDGLLLSLG